MRENRAIAVVRSSFVHRSGRPYSLSGLLIAAAESPDL
jgi:hypothetical protein